ncbi:MAG: helix-turn-helix transcriptional regulator, partial [Chloroflexus sp.]|nr:helix-turn-helix transcriptional regulator [Chloroflexus sp.]
MSLGQKIGRLRQERGLTLQEVAEGSGLTPSFLSRLERDKVNISVANLRKLAQFFSVQMTHFFEGED